ncbi:MAG: hypothetical protein RIM80_09860, partial [Alphaproteobacteria bacterium]
PAPAGGRWGDRRSRFGERRWEAAAPRFRRPGRPAGAVGASLREARLLYGLCRRPELAEPLAERTALLQFVDGELDALRRALVETLVSDPAIDADALRATLMARGLGAAIQRIDDAVKGRALPSALVGDAAEAADWLCASVEAIERFHEDRSMLERARAISDDDEPGFAAVDVDAIARARPVGGETG